MRKLTIIIVLLLSVNSYTQEKKCADFKTGTFEYSNPIYSDWKITRTDKLQIETDTIHNIVIHASVNWTSDCEYELTYTKVSDPGMQTMVGQTMQVKIIRVSTDRILCLSKSNGVDLELEMVSVN